MACLRKNQGVGLGLLVLLVEVFVEVSLVPVAVLDPLGLAALPWPLLLVPRSVLY